MLMFVNGHNRPTRLNTEKDEDQEALKIMPKSYMPN
jgi:hypothetical protein